MANCESTDDFYIKVTIKGKTYQLNKVGSPDFLEFESEFGKKQSLRGYVMTQFYDLVNDKNDISKIQYNNGTNILYDYDYKDTDETLEEYHTKLFLNSKK